VACFHVPVVANLGHQAIAVEARGGAPGQRARRTMLVEQPRPALHAGPVAPHDRGAESHLVDALLVRERPGDVVADALPSTVGWPERGGAVRSRFGTGAWSSRRDAWGRGDRRHYPASGWTTATAPRCGVPR
jgi:hypothetical protein